MRNKWMLKWILFAFLVAAVVAFAQNLAQYPVVATPQSFAWMGGIPTDPCATSATAKSSVPINISAGATSALVAVSGTTAVYVCGFSMTISQVATTANTIQFGYSTVAACASAVTALTGLYGAGGVTAAAPLAISQGGLATIFKTPSANGLCVTTAIGASGNFSGVLDYVQQ